VCGSSPGLVDGRGLWQAIDGTELEQLRARLEVAGATGGEGLEPDIPGRRWSNSCGHVPDHRNGV
jgi:hypothetical protein